jgi:hypothetical protein
MVVELLWQPPLTALCVSTAQPQRNPTSRANVLFVTALALDSKKAQKLLQG